MPEYALVAILGCIVVIGTFMEFGLTVGGLVGKAADCIKDIPGCVGWEGEDGDGRRADNESPFPLPDQDEITRIEPGSSAKPNDADNGKDGTGGDSGLADSGGGGPNGGGSQQKHEEIPYLVLADLGDGSSSEGGAGRGPGDPNPRLDPNTTYYNPITGEAEGLIGDRLSPEEQEALFAARDVIGRYGGGRMSVDDIRSLQGSLPYIWPHLSGGERDDIRRRLGLDDRFDPTNPLDIANLDPGNERRRDRDREETDLQKEMAENKRRMGESLWPQIFASAGLGGTHPTVGNVPSLYDAAYGPGGGVGGDYNGLQGADSIRNRFQALQEQQEALNRAQQLAGDSTAPPSSTSTPVPSPWYDPIAEAGRRFIATDAGRACANGAVLGATGGLVVGGPKGAGIGGALGCVGGAAYGIENMEAKAQEHGLENLLIDYDGSAPGVIPEIAAANVNPQEPWDTPVAVFTGLVGGRLGDFELGRNETTGEFFWRPVNDEARDAMLALRAACSAGAPARCENNPAFGPNLRIEDDGRGYFSDADVVAWREQLGDSASLPVPFKRGDGWIGKMRRDEYAGRYGIPEHSQQAAAVAKAPSWKQPELVLANLDGGVVVIGEASLLVMRQNNGDIWLVPEDQRASIDLQFQIDQARAAGADPDYPLAPLRHGQQGVGPRPRVEGVGGRPLLVWTKDDIAAWQSEQTPESTSSLWVPAVYGGQAGDEIGLLSPAEYRSRFAHEAAASVVAPSAAPSAPPVDVAWYWDGYYATVGLGSGALTAVDVGAEVGLRISNAIIDEVTGNRVPDALNGPINLLHSTDSGEALASLILPGGERPVSYDTGWYIGATAVAVVAGKKVQATVLPTAADRARRIQKRERRAAKRTARAVARIQKRTARSVGRTQTRHAIRRERRVAAVRVDPRTWWQRYVPGLRRPNPNGPPPAPGAAPTPGRLARAARFVTRQVMDPAASYRAARTWAQAAPGRALTWAQNVPGNIAAWARGTRTAGRGTGPPNVSTNPTTGGHTVSNLHAGTTEAELLLIPNVGVRTAARIRAHIAGGNNVRSLNDLRGVIRPEVFTRLRNQNLEIVP